jgi:hypothetical protein
MSIQMPVRDPRRQKVKEDGVFEPVPEIGPIKYRTDTE